jgi:hypothetical protein
LARSTRRSAPVVPADHDGSFDDLERRPIETEKQGLVTLREPRDRGFDQLEIHRWEVDTGTVQVAIVGTKLEPLTAGGPNAS